MKIKTLATFAVAGLAAAGMAYILPAYAEEAFDDGFGAQQFALADNSSTQGASPNDLGNSTANNMPTQQEVASNTSPNVNNNPSPANQASLVNQISQTTEATQPSQANQGSQAGQPSQVNQTQASNQSSQAPASNTVGGDQPTADVASGDEDF